MVKSLVFFAVVLLGFATHPSDARTSTGSPPSITAIDIALEPDATMLLHATALNERLRQSFPKGYALDTTPTEPDINAQTLAYVADFVPNSTGKNYVAHVTCGVASVAFVKTLEAQPFSSFAFSPVALSVYQLGNFGTARKKLKEWTL